MQAQPQKRIDQDSSHKQRLSVGEVVVAVLDLMIGAVEALIAIFLLVNAKNNPTLLFPGILSALITLGATVTGILIFLRQRQLAVYAQWVGVLGAFSLFGLIVLWLYKNDVSLSGILYTLPLLVVALILTWFAWFLKRMDEKD
jgi:hypothetical protein